MTADKDQTPHPVDVHVGRQMRRRRLALGLSQTALAAKLGVSFQAVQKYETGDIRISASRLYEVAQALEVEPGYFFAGYPDEGLEFPAGEAIAGSGAPVLDRRDVLMLVRFYQAILD